MYHCRCVSSPYSKREAIQHNWSSLATTPHTRRSRLLASSAAAYADTFTITGQGEIITFSLPDSPTPSSYVDTIGFNISNVEVTLNGITSFEDVGFSDARLGDPIFIGSPNEIYPNGISSTSSIFFSVGNWYQLYTGSATDPTFIIGTYSIETWFDPSSGGTSYLTISPDVATTPEPSSLALLGTGVAGIAGLVRRRFIA